MDALQKITEAQMDANGVCSAPNVLNGTIAQNKAVFDKMVRQLVAPAYNAAVDAIGEIDATETGIQAAEALRVTAESGRVSAENGRVSAENGRLSSEALRGSAENSRIGAEAARSAAESSRVSAETERAGAELGRINSETGRAAAETARAATEVARVGAETQRAAAESARNVWESYNAAKAYTAGNKVAYQGSSYVCVQAGAGNLPTNAAYWTLIAAKGVDGEGAGDMLAATYDPTGKAQDIFAYADQKASGSAAAVQVSLNAHAGRTDNPHGVTLGQIGAAAENHTHTAAQVGAIPVGALKFTEVASYTTPGAYNFIPTSAQTLIIAVVCGAGGGGSSGGVMESSETGGGNGGGGGFILITPLLTVTPGVALPVVVGIGGLGANGGATSAVAGADGGASSFMSYTALGGKGGPRDGTKVAEGGAKGGSCWALGSLDIAPEGGIGHTVVPPYLTFSAGGGASGDVGGYNDANRYAGRPGGVSDIGNGGTGGNSYIYSPVTSATAGLDGGTCAGGGGGGKGRSGISVYGAKGGNGGPGMVKIFAVGA